MNARIFTTLALALTLSACKIQITAPPQGFIVNTSNGICEPGTTCEVDVVDTNFEDTYRAVGITDNWIFTGWINQPNGFCGGITGTCSLSTRFFGGNADLLALLESDAVYFLEPGFTGDLNSVFPAAAPVTFDGGNVIAGLSAADSSVDFFAVVAPGNGVMQVSLSQFESDLDVTVMRPVADNFLDTFGNVLASASSSGNNSEQLSLEVERGKSYFIGVSNVNQQETRYLLELGFDSQDKAVGRKKMKGNYRIQAGRTTVDCTNGERGVEKEGRELEWRLDGKGKRTSVPNSLETNNGTMDLYLATTRYDAATGAYLERLTYRDVAADGSLIQTRYELTTGRFGGGGKFKGETWSYTLQPTGGGGDEFVACIGNNTLKS